jgi:BTB/POZ domain
MDATWLSSSCRETIHEPASVCPPPPSSQQEGRNFRPLSWTTDAAEAQEYFSDWTIQVKHGGGGGGGTRQRNTSDQQQQPQQQQPHAFSATTTSSTTKIYYVHKVILAVGPRHSEYFASLFRCDQHHQPVLRERHDATSVLNDLTDAEADALPLLLNFVYHGGFMEQQQAEFARLVVPINESLIIGLCQLGQYLLIPALLSSVATVCGRQLSLEQLLTLTAELSTVLLVEHDLEAFYDVAASLLLAQAPVLDPELAPKIHPELLIRAIHKQQHPNSSTAITHHHHHHNNNDHESSFATFNDQTILTSMESFKDELTRPAFDFLSWGIICTRNDPYLTTPPPPVRGRTAMRLLLLDAHIITKYGTANNDDQDNNDDDIANNNNNNRDPPDRVPLSRLQEKCVEAITYRYPTSHNRKHRVNSGYAFGLPMEYAPSSEGAADDILWRLPQHVLVAIIERLASQQAHGDVLRTVLEDKSLSSRR